MRDRVRRLAALLLAVVALPAPSAGQPAAGMAEAEPCPLEAAECRPPSVPREFRGAWVATVANRDWPSRAGLRPDSARAELVKILDHAARTGLNAIVFQVRPAGDALYASAIEPWSEYLTGRQGIAPLPTWDPLAFAVREAHARGLELHAWFNPYRARDPSAKGPLGATHLARQYPAYAKRYGQYLWFDPGEPAVRRRTVRVVLDVVRRYDVDGIHLDDYFYPYPVERAGADLPFPDDASFARYVRSGGTLTRDDWRRENVDRLVDTLRREIGKAKPWVKFGISPFGIWRPGEPPGITGFDAYARIFADARRWWSSGWVDYLVPQLYWGIEQEGQQFGTLLRWWQAQNDSARHLWPGLAAYKIGDPRARWRSSELVRQVDSTRAVEGVGGAVHFPMSVLLEDRDSIATSLAARHYLTRALVPASPWKAGVAPDTPSVTAAANGDRLTIAPRGQSAVRWWVIQALVDGDWRTHVMDGARRAVSIASIAGTGRRPDVIAVTPVGRTGLEGVPAAIRSR